MNAPPETHDVEVIKRFLLRFSDLMSNGSNSSNLLLAAQLLEANVKRANDSEGQLRQERSNCVDLTAQLAALSSDSHILAPISILRLARSQFESLARAFEKSGDVISQAMCEASAATLERILEAKAPRNKVLVPPPIEASRERLWSPASASPGGFRAPEKWLNEIAMTHSPDLQMRHLDVDTAIRLRWALRDIKGKRTKLMPVSPDDVRTLVELGLIEMRDDAPVLTDEGERALDWSWAFQ
jgi:hypothetical protein